MSALEPGLQTVTPIEEVRALSTEKRHQRVNHLIGQAHYIADEAWYIHGQGHAHAGTCILFSGGNDSTVLAHLFKDRATHVIHANTGIGIPATHQFVRDVCADWNLPLLEKHPPTSYRELVITHGFPGPGHHYKMYQRLKERCLRQARKDLVTDPRNQRVLFIAGRRRSESGRRSGFRKGKLAVPLDEREGSTVWASPIAMWLKEDLVTYRAMMKQQGDPVPFNPVTDHLGMSGECLCGSFATDGELERIRFWYPDFAAEIDALSKEVATCWQEPHCRWGHGIGGTSRRMGRLCSSCQ